MSKFFGASSSEASDSDSSDDEVKEVVAPLRKATGRDMRLPSDSEDEEKRVVRAHKDKKFDQLKEYAKIIKAGKNIKDITKVQTAFEDLIKAFDKSKTVFARQNIGTPRFYVRCVVELEDFANQIWDDKEAKQALSKVNLKALTGLRQRVRKYAKELNTKVAEYRANADPVGYETPEDQVAEDETEEIVPPKPVKAAEKTKAKPEKKKPKVPDSDASDDSDMDSSDDDTDDDWAGTGSDSSSTDSEFDANRMEDLRKYFLKKEFREDDVKDPNEKRKRREQRPGAAKKEETDDEDDEGWTAVTKEKQQALFDPKQEITHEVLLKKLLELVSQRGRGGSNRKQLLNQLHELYAIVVEKKLGVGLEVKVLFEILTGLFELNLKLNEYMDIEHFTKALEIANDLLKKLENNSNVTLSIRNHEDDENLIDDTKDYRVIGSFLMVIHRLDAELTKILQNADCHSNDYIEKLRCERDICALIDVTEIYMESVMDKELFEVDEICKVYMMRIEHLYYKYQDTVETVGVEPDQVGALMETLCKKIYKRDEEKRLRQRAMLCHVYWLALHDHWHRARDLLLMSHLQAIVDHSDIDTQILYNRTICQLGLCAFRHGFIKEAHQGLSEIQNTQRAKELLAQAVAMRQHERTNEQEKIERSRQVPYHMHINVELMECVYLICSMLLEIPHMASCEFEMRRRLLSRSFHYQLKLSEKASLVGPPENTREHVVAASRAMLAGDWQKCRNYIVNDKMNQKVWNLFRNADSVKNMVVRRIQEEALRTYLLMYSTVYSTVSLEKLSGLFELDKQHVHSIISRMIIQEELSATLDEPSDCVMMHRVEPSRLQMLALNLTDKLQVLAENNEQILEPRTGRSGYTGPGAWFQGRDRQGENKKTDRTGNYQGERRQNAQGDKGRSGVWGGQGGAQRRREPQKRF